MTAANYDRAYAFERKWEGGNDDDPADNGGRTSRGITQREYDAWRKEQSLKPRDVWTASEDEIAAIYRNKYWKVVKGDELPSGVDLIVFDAGVHSGPGQSIKWAQRAANAKGAKLTVDGKIGPATIAALHAAEPKALINSMCDQRLEMLEDHEDWDRYGEGWSNRVADVRATALSWASGANGAPPAPAVLDVATLQKALNLFGYGLATDGKFGPKSAAALDDFTQRLGAFKASQT